MWNDFATENRLYAVEISGWDTQENFFVERTRLEWAEQGRASVLLHNRVNNGSMIFLRLLEAKSPPANLPVAYRAVNFSPAAPRERAEVQLIQMWPQSRFRPGCSPEPSR